MSSTREQTVQAPLEATQEPAPAGGVPLSALLSQARRRGMVTVPAFVTVGLVQQLCRALQQAHEQGVAVFGELNLEAVQVSVDGRVRPTAFGDPARDVAAAALILDQLLDDTLDPELTRIIGDARLKDPVITTALALERRLAHWQVKQLQLFPGTDLTAALVSWLFPQQARAAPDDSVREWLETQCTGPIVDDEPIARAPTKPVNWRRLALAGAGVSVLLLLLSVLAQLFYYKRFTTQGLVPPAVVAAPMPLAPPRVAPVPAPAAEPTLPNTATGAPATVQLSSTVHGVRLEASGFPVTAPGRRWAAKVLPMPGQKKAPPYGSLFVAELGDSKVARLSRVGPEGWSQLGSREARFFLMQTDTPPDEGSFSLALGRTGVDGTTMTEVREGVLTDAMTQIEYSRFVLDGLEVGRTYEVLQPQAGPPVVALATIPNVHTRQLKSAGFKQAGAPLDQVLLAPGVPARVSGVSRLSFVVLTTDAAPEVLTTIEVVPRGPAPRPVADPITAEQQETLEGCRRFAPNGSCEALGKQR